MPPRDHAPMEYDVPRMEYASTQRIQAVMRGVAARRRLPEQHRAHRAARAQRQQQQAGRTQGRPRPKEHTLDDFVLPDERRKLRMETAGLLLLLELRAATAASSRRARPHACGARPTSAPGAEHRSQGPDRLLHRVRC